jgi:hypothetical protein
MSKAICDFCGKEFESAPMMEVLKLEMRPSQFTRNIVYEGLFMCFSCLAKLETNNAYNCSTFRAGPL